MQHAYVLLMKYKVIIKESKNIYHLNQLTLNYVFYYIIYNNAIIICKILFKLILIKFLNIL